MTDKTDSKEREALRSIGEEQAFEAWFKVDCPVEGANAKIAAKAAWKARASLAASAGSEPVAPEDYVPMLDDEGRMMIGASHHYTAENIRALVAEYKALEAGAPEAMERYSNSDHRTRAGVLWRVISALADEVPFTHPSPPEGMVGGWIALPGTLPEPGTPVLLDIGKKYPIRAMWAAKHTVQAADDDTDWGEYDEATETYYCPEGWYEWNEHEDTNWAVSATPRAWAPLPPISSADSRKGE